MKLSQRTHKNRGIQKAHREGLDYIEDVRLYNQAKLDRTPGIPGKLAFQMIEAKRKKLRYLLDQTSRFKK